MNTKLLLLFSLAVLLAVTGCKNRHGNFKHHKYFAISDSTLTPSQLLGKKLFFDPALSVPSGKSCASCHTPTIGFTDPEMLPVSRGALKEQFGNRNSPTVAYAAFSPFFHYDSAEETYVGGLFWDGRSNTLSEQAMNPLLNHAEMNNPDKADVVNVVKKSNYKNLFLHVYGQDAFTDTEKAFEYISESLEEYEETREISPFTSKFDYYLKGMAALTDEEARGLKIFNDPAKGNCAACHPSTPDNLTGAILFTDFTYDNIGVPANPEISKLCKDHQCDLGLGAIVHRESENGKFKVPTLRNVALTPPYFHNGVFKTLEEVVRFYNSRDTGKFGAPEYPENVNKEELGNLKLTDRDITDLVAFMKTLTDGYNPNE